jgi:hypothetical protein
MGKQRNRCLCLCAGDIGSIRIFFWGGGVRQKAPQTQCSDSGVMLGVGSHMTNGDVFSAESGIVFGRVS